MRLLRLYGKNEPSSQKMKVFQGLKLGKDFAHLSSELDIKKGTAEVYGIDCLAAGGSVDHEMIANYLKVTPDAFHRIKSAIQSNEDLKLRTIRDGFDLEFSYNQIRFVLACLIQEIEL